MCGSLDEKNLFGKPFSPEGSKYGTKRVPSCTLFLRVYMAELSDKQATPPPKKKKDPEPGEGVFEPL